MSTHAVSPPDSPAPSRGLFESALSLATLRVPVAASQDTAGDITRRLPGQAYDCASVVVLLDEGRLAGVIPLESLLAAPPEAPAATLLDREAPRVAPDCDQEHAALAAVRHGRHALAVVDGNGCFLGLIPPGRLLSVLLQEHEEDLTRLGGFLTVSRTARQSGEEPVGRRVRHRIPWLLVGVAGALIAATLVGWFEAQLQAALAMAFFVPSVVYLADAVGTQTETVVVRALSVGIPLPRMALREILTGMLIGLSVALLSGLLIGVIWQDWLLSLGVGISLFAACSIASTIALLLPWLLDRHGIDPAVGSGPLATVIQDLLSILIYFLVMTRVLDV